MRMVYTAPPRGLKRWKEFKKLSYLSKWSDTTQQAPKWQISGFKYLKSYPLPSNEATVLLLKKLSYLGNDVIRRSLPIIAIS